MHDDIYFELEDLDIPDDDQTYSLSLIVSPGECRSPQDLLGHALAIVRVGNPELAEALALALKDRDLRREALYKCALALAHIEAQGEP